MSAPNILALNSGIGKTQGRPINDVSVDLLENPAGSGQVYKINAVSVGNIDGTNEVGVTVGVFDASANQTIRPAGTNVPIPAKTGGVLVDKEFGIYLEEGDKITAIATASGDAEGLVAYEILY